MGTRVIIEKVTKMTENTSNMGLGYFDEVPDTRTISKMTINIYQWVIYFLGSHELRLPRESSGCSRLGGVLAIKSASAAGAGFGSHQSLSGGATSLEVFRYREVKFKRLFFGKESSVTAFGFLKTVQHSFLEESNCER